jgi:hypothetical protein
MTQVGRGSRLALRVGDRTVVLRALADRDLDGDWSLPVLALATGPDDLHGVVDITTDAGVVTLGARLVHDDGGLALHRAGADSPARVQRRHDVRGPLALPLRAAVLDPRVRQDLTDLAFHGATLDVSAGGLRVDPGDAGPDAEHLPAAARLFVELELPDEVLVPAVVSLVEPGTQGLHGAFVDIAAADRERLVRLVFAEQRRMLAARKRSRGGLPTDHLLTSRRRDPFSP